MGEYHPPAETGAVVEENPRRVHSVDWQNNSRRQNNFITLKESSDLKSQRWMQIAAGGTGDIVLQFRGSSYSFDRNASHSEILQSLTETIAANTINKNLLLKLRKIRLSKKKGEQQVLNREITPPHSLNGNTVKEVVTELLQASPDGLREVLKTNHVIQQENGDYTSLAMLVNRSAVIVEIIDNANIDGDKNDTGFLSLNGGEDVEEEDLLSKSYLIGRSLFQEIDSGNHLGTGSYSKVYDASAKEYDTGAGNGGAQSTQQESKPIEKVLKYLKDTDLRISKKTVQGLSHAKELKTRLKSENPKLADRFSVPEVYLRLRVGFDGNVILDTVQMQTKQDEGDLRSYYANKYGYTKDFHAGFKDFPASFDGFYTGENDPQIGIDLREFAGFMMDICDINLALIPEDEPADDHYRRLNGKEDGYSIYDLNFSNLMKQRGGRVAAMDFDIMQLSWSVEAFYASAEVGEAPLILKRFIELLSDGELKTAAVTLQTAINKVKSTPTKPPEKRDAILEVKAAAEALKEM